MFNKNLIKFCVLLSLLALYSCSNTRVILEGTKKIIQTTNNENDIIDKKAISFKTTGHYKVGNPYEIQGKRYIPKLFSKYDEVGVASWYGPNFDKKLTANGEIFDQDAISAAHKTLPLPSIVKVTNFSNNKVLYIRVNDRGPFVNDRIIDLSKKAAIIMNFYSKGTTSVRVELIETGPHLLEKKDLNQEFLTSYARSLENSKVTKLKKEYNVLFQIAAFKEKENAKKLLKFLKTKFNDNLFLKSYSTKSKNAIHKVFIGPFDDQEYANKVYNQLGYLGYDAIYKKSEE